MGSIAFLTSGAVLYNPLSSSNGSLASYYEWDSLDPCYGHSDSDKQYHYHAVSTIRFVAHFCYFLVLLKKVLIMPKLSHPNPQIASCISVATTASYPGTLVGYAVDGYPIYGYSTNSAGTTLKSCWSTTKSSPTTVSDFTYDSTGYKNGTCHLDYVSFIT